MNEPPLGEPDNPGTTRGVHHGGTRISRHEPDEDESMQEAAVNKELPEQQLRQSAEVCPEATADDNSEPNGGDAGSERERQGDSPGMDVRSDMPAEATCSPTTDTTNKTGDDVTPQQKLGLLLNSLKESSPARPLVTEHQLAVELFAAAVKRNHFANEEQQGRVMKPLTVKDKQRLLKLARVIMKTAARAEDAWENALDKVLLLVAQAKWHLTKALDNVTSNLEVECTPVLHEWIKVVNGSKEEASIVATSATTAEERFMFNPAKYSAEDQKRLLDTCLRQYDPAANKADSSDDEWHVIEGIAAGDILCRTLPPVLMKVLGAEGCFELQLMLHANIEGELKMKLDANEDLHPTQRTTERVIQLIGTAAASRQQSTKDLYTMLASIKTVHYEASTHTIVFTFFSRVAALRCANVRVPFGRRLHTLHNTHIRGNAVHAMKPLRTALPHYHVRLRNLTRSMDLSRLYQWFKGKIPFGFEMVDLDTYSKHSRTSNTWEMRFQIGHCPEYLRGILRVIWFGEVIVLEHPRNKREKQCLACGDPGHLARRCEQTVAMLQQGDAVVVIDEREVAALGTPKPAFKTLAELTAAIAQRQQKDSAGPVAQLPVEISSKPHAPAERSQATGKNNSTQRDPADKLRDRVREESWTTVTNSAVAAVPYNVIQSTHQSGNQHWPSNQEVIDLLVSDDEDSANNEEAIAEASQNKPATREQPRTSRSIQLLSSVAQSRDAIAAAVQEESINRGGPLQMQLLGHAAAKFTTFAEVERTLGLRALRTPPTGNCQVLAVAQALLSEEHNTQPELIHSLGRMIKVGVQQLASLNFGKEFPHAMRARILQNGTQEGEQQHNNERPIRTSVRKKVTYRNSAKLFTQWLEEYASSPTDGITVLPRELWGNNETLRMMTVLLKKDIFVLGSQVGPDEQSIWNCTRYSCFVRTKNGATFQSAKSTSLDISVWIQVLSRALIEAETNPSDAPIVVRFQDDHHTAYSHFGDARKPTNQVNTIYQADSETEVATRDETHMEVDEQAIEPRAGQTWTADTSADTMATVELHGNEQTECTGATRCRPVQCILPESALEIKILLSGEETTQKNLLNFFKFAVPDMTEVEKERLRLANGFDGAELMGFFQQHQVSEASYQQWKTAPHDQSDNLMGIAPVVTSDPNNGMVAINPADTWTMITTEGRQDGQREKISIAASAGNGKRNHVPTPIKKKQVHGAVVNARNANVPLKKTRSAATEEYQTQRRLLTEFADAAIASDSDSSVELNATPTPDDWRVLWDKKATEWTRRTKIRFPRTTDTARQWAITSEKEPLLLIQMVREFAFPARVLEVTSTHQTEQWTAGWRMECIEEELRSLQKSMEPGPEQHWVSTWLDRINHATTTQQRQLMADGADDWKRARSIGNKFGRVLHLCSPRLKGSLGRHLLSALCYAIELKAKSQLPILESQTVHQMLHLHLLQVDQDEYFKAAFTNVADYVEWDSVHNFFTAKALVTVDQTQSQY